MRFLAALSFLTIIPVPRGREASPEELGRSQVFFPVVGLIIGFILAGLNWLWGRFWPAAVVNGLLLFSLVAITGALHLDGFIDTCDGSGGQKTVTERWQIMHDSRAGAFGIVGAVLLLLIKYVSLSSLPAGLLMPTLVLMPVVSRWAMVYAILAYPYARSTGLGKVFKQEASWWGLTLATIMTLAIAMAVARWADFSYFYLAGLAIMLGIWAIVIILAAYLSRKFSGLTGDSYGAINEVAEVAVLLLVGLLAYHHWL